MTYPYFRESPYVGAAMFFLSRKRFIDMAVNHGMACNLECDDQRKLADERGEELLKQWEDKYRTDYTKMAEAISSALWSSLSIITIVIASAIAIAMYLGKIPPNLPLDKARATTFVGSSLIAWATLMELGGNFPVWDGKPFPQLALTIIFKCIFVPGVLLVLLSILL